MIRPADIGDLPDIVRMGRDFASVSGAPFPFDAESAITTIRNLIASPSGVVLVADIGPIVGMTGALIHPHYFNSSHITGQELFWWIDPPYRGSKIGLEMFHSLEEWARSSGANSFSMIALHAQNPEKIGRLYERNGYVPLENSYTKVL